MPPNETEKEDIAKLPAEVQEAIQLRRALGILSDVKNMSDEELKDRIKKIQELIKERIRRMRRLRGEPEEQEVLREVAREEAQRAYGQ